MQDACNLQLVSESFNGSLQNDWTSEKVDSKTSQVASDELPLPSLKSFSFYLSIELGGRDQNIKTFHIFGPRWSLTLWASEEKLETWGRSWNGEWELKWARDWTSEYLCYKATEPFLVSWALHMKRRSIISQNLTLEVTGSFSSADWRMCDLSEMLHLFLETTRGVHGGGGVGGVIGAKAKSRSSSNRNQGISTFVKH